MVQDMNVMKLTKNTRQRGGLRLTTGPAITDQSSAVTRRKSVKSEAGMSANRSRTVWSSCGSSVSTMSPWPMSLVSMMASTKQKRKIIVRIHTKVFIICRSRLTQSCSGSHRRITRPILSSRVSISMRTRLRLPLADVWTSSCRWMSDTGAADGKSCFITRLTSRLCSASVVVVMRGLLEAAALLRIASSTARGATCRDGMSAGPRSKRARARSSTPRTSTQASNLHLQRVLPVQSKFIGPLCTTRRANSAA
mmetsp:Transcript_32666/g.74066  ORF Transcript_32666/g.74066 Transcript_32666/m.74066 type:complete len:252 (+) Transcript_32666:748-1503(+)